MFLTKKIKYSPFIFILLAVLIYACGKNEPVKNISTETKNGSFPLSLFKDVQHSLTQGNKWLVMNQLPDGSWKENPAITSLVLYAMVENPGKSQDEETTKAVEKGFAYLKKFIKADGGIYDTEYQHYSTAVALMALATYDKADNETAITKAKDFLIKSQCDESENIPEDNPYYGGIGYGGDDRPDLSNTQFALDAIQYAEKFEATYRINAPDTGESMEMEKREKGLHWQKALVFLARCQNAQEVNSMPYRTLNDGGFMYETGKYKEDRSHSYGSMTYAGVKSLLYAEIAKSDIRVQRAIEWIKANYTLEENPGFNSTSLYYYYMTMSKCLSVLGDRALTDTKGITHFWQEELAGKMVSLQKGDGFWVNTDGRYWENIPELTTAYSLIALKFAIKGLSQNDFS